MYKKCQVSHAHSTNWKFLISKKLIILVIPSKMKILKEGKNTQSPEVLMRQTGWGPPHGVGDMTDDSVWLIPRVRGRREGGDGTASIFHVCLISLVPVWPQLTSNLAWAHSHYIFSALFFSSEDLLMPCMLKRFVVDMRSDLPTFTSQLLLESFPWQETFYPSK